MTQPARSPEEIHAAHIVTALLTTLRLMDGQPETYLQLGLMLSLSQWETLRHHLTSNGVIAVNNNLVTLTTAGRSLADRLQAAMDADAQETSQ